MSLASLGGGALPRTVLVLVLLTITAREASAIPAFARRYRTTCSSCHTVAPKLNSVGEAFRQHGYRLREFDEALLRDTGLPLGDDAWRDLWPRGIWPGEIPSGPPISLRIQADVVSLSRGQTPVGLHLRLPHEIYLLAGASLGDGLAAFVELEVAPDEGLHIAQARLTFTDLVRTLPAGVMNLTVGRLNPFLFTFADRQIDRAGILEFGWQGYRVSELRLRGAGGASVLESPNRAQLGGTTSALELHGVLRGRLYYGAGIAQGAGSGEDDNNARKDAYVKLRYKWGGLRLDGRYEDGSGPPPGGDGQRWDRAFIVEGFGYAGEEPVAAAVGDRYRGVGANARILQGPLDVGVGFVARRDADPWGTGAEAQMRSLFAKGEYYAWPWLGLSLKLERFTADSREAREAGYMRGAEDRIFVAPGVIALLRQNLRFVVEGDLRARDREAADRGVARPRGVWMRLDVAF